MTSFHRHRKMPRRYAFVSIPVTVPRELPVITYYFFCLTFSISEAFFAKQSPKTLEPVSTDVVAKAKTLYPIVLISKMFVSADIVWTIRQATTELFIAVKLEWQYPCQV